MKSKPNQAILTTKIDSCRAAGNVLLLLPGAVLPERKDVEGFEVVVASSFLHWALDQVFASLCSFSLALSEHCDLR